VGESVFLHELCYTPGISPIELKQLYFGNGFTASDPVYCDHDPDMIAACRRLGMLALPARKGIGSVNAGIMKLKEFNVYYTASSTNIDNERKRYIWINDPDTGRPTNRPIDMWNHTIDASRVGVYTHYFSS
jgi:phage terminase large subunit